MDRKQMLAITERLAGVNLQAGESTGATISPTLPSSPRTVTTTSNDYNPDSDFDDSEYDSDGYGYGDDTSDWQSSLLCKTSLE